MNIFPIESNLNGDIDWIKSAQSLDNLRVVKMILESAQLMCTAINVLEGEQITPYKSTHKNHPCSIWTRESYFNFHNLYEHAIAMNKEYTERFNKEHKCLKVIEDCYSYALIHRFDRLWKKYPDKESSPPLCMPNEFKDDDVVESYRKFYASKPRMKYPKDKIPGWFIKYRGDMPFEII